MIRFISICVTTLGMMLGFAIADANAQKSQRRYASIVVDSDSLEVVHARQIDEERYPASLTKVMTLYLTFDALNAGTLTLDQELTVSAHAARTAPTKLGLRKGQTLSVAQAIQAVAVRSANDAAVVLAEAVAGTEKAFARQMTEKARELRMRHTTFKNPHGLPHPEQMTTARDMAKLASATLNHHRSYYHYFGQKTFSYKGRIYRNTNNLLHQMEDVDGLKTGFTNASGYNLIISAQRDGRRLIAVVLGGASGYSRDLHMAELMERGFKVIKEKPPLVLAGATPQTPKPVSEPTPIQTAQAVSATLPAKATLIPASYTTEHPAQPAHVARLRGTGDQPLTVINGQRADITLPRSTHADNWAIQVGAFANLSAAQAHLHTLSTFSAQSGNQSLIAGLASAIPNISPLPAHMHPGNTPLYRTRFTQLTFEDAQKACHGLQHIAMGCFVVAPG